jgi:hypothetical protein|tara:strand:+ start:117 stop:290 length:174 start_codon:yes stop_codon:yes gene_type:complete
LEQIKSHIKSKRIQLRDSPLAELNKMEAVDVDDDENEDIVPVAQGGKEDSAATTITH